MSDEIIKPDQNASGETKATTTESASSNESKKTGEATFTQAQVDQIISARLKAEAEKREKAIENERKRAEAEQLAKNAEWEKLARQREEEIGRLQGEMTKAQLDVMRRDVAASVGLPAALASRLAGSTREEIEADAKALAETLPRPQKPNPGPVTNPGAGGATGETMAQRAEKIHAKGPNAFDTDFLRSLGGGNG